MVIILTFLIHIFNGSLALDIRDILFDIDYKYESLYHYKMNYFIFFLQLPLLYFILLNYASLKFIPLKFKLK